MAIQEPRRCKLCNKITLFEWQCEKDSEYLNPQFFLQCVDCGHQIPAEPPIPQKELQSALESLRTPYEHTGEQR